jgi:hypothetical protein
MANPLTQLANIKRRLAKLAPERPYVDMAPFTVPVIMAMFEGRPFSYIRREPSKPRSEESEDARRRVLANLDSVAKRLENGDPGGAARFQADIERKRKANIAALEREQAEREAA